MNNEFKYCEKWSLYLTTSNVYILQKKNMGYILFHMLWIFVSEMAENEEKCFYIFPQTLFTYKISNLKNSDLKNIHFITS